MPAQCIVTQLALRQKHRLRRRIALRHKGKGMAASITPRLGFHCLRPIEICGDFLLSTVLGWLQCRITATP